MTFFTQLRMLEPIENSNLAHLQFPAQRACEGQKEVKFDKSLLGLLYFLKFKDYI